MAAFREQFNGHVTKAYVSDSNQFMVAYWSVYGDFSAILYKETWVLEPLVLEKKAVLFWGVKANC
jgi:hypothetical protein